MTVLFMLLMLVAFLTADHVVQRFRARKVGQVVRERVTSMVESFKQIPAGVELALNHTWLKQEAASIVTIGFDEFIAKFFGTIDRIVLPEAGALADAIMMQDGGRSCSLTLPVRGRVLAVNPDVLRNPSAAHTDPYGSGWLLRVQLEPGAPRRVPVITQASQWLKEQVGLAREFILRGTATESYAHMQDGGTPVDGVLKMYDNAVWEEFAEKFLTAPVDLAPAAGGTK